MYKHTEQSIVSEPQAIYSAVVHDEFENEKALNKRIEELETGILRVLNAKEIRLHGVQNRNEA